VASAQIIAGKKEINSSNANVFTGVVLGDCTTESDDSLSKIGLYGFSKGV
jgi:hypothetical protein